MYDKDIALAELERMRIVMAHHLRRICIEGDLDTAKMFATLLGKTASDASYTVHKIRKEKNNAKNNSNNDGNSTVGGISLRNADRLSHWQV